MRSQTSQPFQIFAGVQATPVSPVTLPTDILDAILSGHTDSVCVYDRGGCHLYTSPASARILGIPTAEIIGKTNQELGLPPEICERTDRALNFVFTHRRPMSLEVLYPTANVMREYETTCSPIYDADGAVQAALCITRDVTERNQAQRAYSQSEAALQQSRERFELVQEAAGLGIWYCDLPFDKLIWNDNVKRHFGLPLDSEVTIDTFYAHLHPDDREHTRQAIERSIANRSSYDIDYRTIGLDGKTRWIRAIGRGFYADDGRPTRFDGITIDVTDRKIAAEERERHLAEIEQLNARLRQAMAETQDLVRNNLQIVNALAEMNDGDSTNIISTPALKRIQQQVGTMADVHDLLSRNAREYGGVGQTISARALLEKLIPTLQSTDSSRALRLSAEDAALPSRLGTALAMITNELVNNAIKHGAGEIEITFRVVAGEATLSIRDHGPGFPPEFIAAACDGTGIELVESLAGWTLRGHADYANAPDGGAYITVTFRFAD